MLILRDSSDWHLCFSRKMSIYYELISLPEKRKSGILDAYRWIFKTAQKGMNHMHNLRKTIRSGSEKETIQALVQKTSDQAYEIKIYKGDQEITDIPGSQVVLPVKEVFPEENPEIIKVTNAEGEKMETSLDKKQNLLTIQTDKTGTFHISGKKEDIQGKPVAAAAMAAITALTVGIRNRSGKRGGSHREEK